jgi:hypothetical protein
LLCHYVRDNCCANFNPIEGRPIGAARSNDRSRRGRQNITNIARSEESSRAWVSRELASAESHHFIAELVDYHKGRMLELFGLTLTAIEKKLRNKSCLRDTP